MEVVEAVEVIEAGEVLRPGKSLLRTSESSVFAYFFGIYIKFGYKNPSILTPLDLVNVAS